MRVGLLSDVHGNAIALTSCLEQLDRAGVERLHFLGDVAGYLPDGRRCLELLLEAGAIPQRGNHEELLARGGGAAPEYAHRAALEDLGAANVKMIGAWPVARRQRWGGRRALLVHGSPDDPLEGRIMPADDLSAFAALDADVVVLGHTHRPLLERTGAVLVINPGSVGLPRDVGSLSACAIYDSDSGEAVIHRVPMDVERVLARYGDAIHPAVRAVLGRTAQTFVGAVSR